MRADEEKEESIEDFLARRDKRIRLERRVFRTGMAIAGICVFLALAWLFIAFAPVV